MVTVLPVTHAPPEGADDASLELSRGTCRTLGLDERLHWARLDELNRFEWPGPDLAPIPRRSGEVTYGLLPKPVYEEVRSKVLTLQRQKALRIQQRT